MKLVNSIQMRELEKRADASGNSFARMMERAGTLSAQALLDQYPAADESFLVFVGPGNNGGDGLVCARALHDAGARVKLYLWKRVPDENDSNWKLAQERGIPFTRAETDEGFVLLRNQVAEATILVDALLGTGVSRPIEGILKVLLGVVTSALDESTAGLAGMLPTFLVERPHVVAIDLPSGLDPDTGALDPATLPADLTITFAFPKVGQFTFPGANAVGELVVADIGIPQEWADKGALDVSGAKEIASLLPARPRDGNKGTFGKVMIASGSLNYSGAPVLAARAAGRIGAGLVTLAVPQTIHAIVASRIDHATFLPLPDRLGDWRPRGANELLAALWDANYDALLVGCGLGRAEGTREFLERLLENLRALENPPPLILDADGLNHLANIPEWWRRFEFSVPPILTPHPGEMARLLGVTTQEVQQDRVGVARAAAAEWSAVVVLKGAYTVIAAPDGSITLNPFANPALATAGTGDVLAGAIAGLVAQYRAQAKRDPNTDSARSAYNAAVVGAYLHALAGELVFDSSFSAGILAGDVADRLPQARQEVTLAN
ncbi:MAG: NAD(P)H-hydrate dehydratase [Anaerolineae bacterium]|nr:NAD(P)H-hydrate dehydratase [Anaerolineae bacterium]